MPFHNYAGPGTDVYLQLLKNKKPVTALDEASLIHDIEYFDPNITLRQADNNMVRNLPIYLKPIVAATMFIRPLFYNPNNKSHILYNKLKQMAIERGFIPKNMGFVSS